MGHMGLFETCPINISSNQNHVAKSQHYLISAKGEISLPTCDCLTILQDLIAILVDLIAALESKLPVVTRKIRLSHLQRILSISR
jgi:hypothetical protein